MGYSRQQFYEIRRNYQTYGSSGLLDRLPGCKGPHPNRLPTEIEQAILGYKPGLPYAWPTAGRPRIALRGITSAPAAYEGFAADMICCPNTTDFYGWK